MILAKVLGLVAVVAAGAFGYMSYQNNHAPELGVSQGRLKPLPDKPNCISSQTDQPGKKVAPLPFKATPQETLAALKKAIEEYGQEQILEQTQDYLHVVFSSPTIGFRDDVEFWLDQPNQVVQVRSASRVGYSDMGVNRQRYEAISKLYQAL